MGLTNVVSKSHKSPAAFPLHCAVGDSSAKRGGQHVTMLVDSWNLAHVVCLFFLSPCTPSLSVGGQLTHRSDSPRLEAN